MTNRSSDTSRDEDLALKDEREVAGESFELSPEEKQEVEENLPPRVQVLHETIRQQGREELERTIAALGWSALAAGLSIGFSTLTRALLMTHLPDAPGWFLVENLGYTVGFLIVILARQQLFTENTMTAVLPLMTEPSAAHLLKLLRLWGVVLLGNLAGVALFAYGIGHMQIIDESVRESVLELGPEIMRNSPWQMFSKGIVAGWLIATMVWLLPAAGTAAPAIILLMTYLIGLGGFTHIVIDSTDVLFLVFHGDLPLTGYVVHFALPTVAGNIVGGSAIFALISHAQVRSDD